MFLNVWALPRFRKSERDTLAPVRVILGKMRRPANSPPGQEGWMRQKENGPIPYWRRRGGRSSTEINKERCASITLSTTPPLAIKNNRSRLPLLSRRGNLL